MLTGQPLIGRGRSEDDEHGATTTANTWPAYYSWLVVSAQGDSANMEVAVSVIKLTDRNRLPYKQFPSVGVGPI